MESVLQGTEFRLLLPTAHRRPKYMALAIYGVVVIEQLNVVSTLFEWVNSPASVMFIEQNAFYSTRLIRGVCEVLTEYMGIIYNAKLPVRF